MSAPVNTTDQTLLGCFHCWENYPTGCKSHSGYYAPLGYSCGHPAASVQPLQREPAINDGYSHQGTPGCLNVDQNSSQSELHRKFCAIDSQRREDPVKSPESASQPLLLSTVSTAKLIREHSEVSESGGALGDAISAQGPMDTFQNEGSSSSLQQVQLAQGAVSTTSDVHLQASTQVATQIPKSGKRYFCNLPGCKSGFTQRHNLKYHLRSHEGLKPYVCQKCERGFGSKSDLRRHLKAKTLPCGDNNISGPV